jgi:hypothetical protein
VTDDFRSAGGPDAPDPVLVEAVAKQLFRAENPPHTLWDTKLHEQSGRSTEGLRTASTEVKDAYRTRAKDALRQGQS